MGQASDPRFLVLHGLRLKGFAEPPAVATAVGLDVDTVQQHLPGLADDELAVHRTGSISGWTLTRTGRQVQQDLAAKDLADSGTTAATVKLHAMCPLCPIATIGRPGAVTPTRSVPSAECRATAYQKPGAASMARCGSDAWRAAPEADLLGATAQALEPSVIRGGAGTLCGSRCTTAGS